MLITSIHLCKYQKLREKYDRSCLTILITSSATKEYTHLHFPFTSTQMFPHTTHCGSQMLLPSKIPSRPLSAPNMCTIPAVGKELNFQLKINNSLQISIMTIQRPNFTNRLPCSDKIPLEQTPIEYDLPFTQR